MKIRFLETYKVKDSEGREFLKDEVYDLPTPSALHFIRRGRAEAFVPEPPKVKTTAEVIKEVQPWTAEKLEEAETFTPPSGKSPRPKGWSGRKK